MSQNPNDPHRPQQPDQPPSNPYGQGFPPAGPSAGPGGHQGTDPRGYPTHGGRPVGNAVESRGFFASLFDFSFTSFVTIKFASFIYVVLLVFIALGWLFSILAGFADSTLAGMLFLLLGWIPGLITLILARVMMEFYIAMVRTSQNTAATRAELEALRADGRRH